MPSLTLKDIPPELHRRLKARALRNRRSLNREAIECLRAATGAAPIDPEALLARARALREQVSGRLTQRELERWKRAGRDRGRYERDRLPLDPGRLHPRGRAPLS